MAAPNKATVRYRDSRLKENVVSEDTKNKINEILGFLSDASVSDETPVPTITYSTLPPKGGKNGDLWLEKVS